MLVDLVFLDEPSFCNSVSVAILILAVMAMSLIKEVTRFTSSKSVPASTRLEDPSRKGTTRTAKSAPFSPCPSREGPYSIVFSVSRPVDPLMWLAGLLALSGDVETNPGPTTQT